MSNRIKVTTSELGRALLLLKGKPLSLDEYLPFKEIYDCDPPLLVVKCGRQIGKSASVSAIMTLKGISMPYFTSLYIAPLSQQVSRFSSTYLDPYLNSPLLKKYFRDTASMKNVYAKSFTNGSQIYLSYAQDEIDADRIRGISADSLSIDEVQDTQLGMMDVVGECLSASPYAYKRVYGTSKNSNNTLEVLFKRSSGNEWCIKCTHCSKWTIPWTEEDCMRMIASPDGPVCVHCSKPIDVKTGKWVSARPDIKDTVGFHVPQFVIGARTSPKKWAELQTKIKTYTRAKLMNEVAGLAAGVAGRILSEQEAMRCCNISKDAFDTCWPMDFRGINNVVLGVDWSCTGSTASYTVISILGYDFNGKCYLLHSEKLQGIDILDQVRRVNHLYHQFGCQIIGSDRGVGVLQGQLLKESLGEDKVMMVQYTSAKIIARYDSPGKYISVDRTSVMDSVILKMKLGIDKFETPNWSLMGNFWADALAIFEEESLSGRRLYRKDEGATDDWLHSVVFGNVAWMVLTGQVQYTDTIDMGVNEA